MNMLVIFLAALIVFALYKGVLVLVCFLLKKLFRISEDKSKEFDFWVSLAIFLIFILIWVVTIEAAVAQFNLNDLEFYFLFCAIGIYSVIWCYISWDAEHFFVKPRWADERSNKKKKALVFLLIFIFALRLGYEQTISAMNNTKIDILFSVTNYTIVAATIAFDRFLNQIYPLRK